MFSRERLAQKLQDDLTGRNVSDWAKGVIVEISALDIVEFIGRMLSNIAFLAKILDAETVVVGMWPCVATTFVKLGVPPGGIQTALNIERGLDLLRASIK